MNAARILFTTATFLLVSTGSQAQKKRIDWSRFEISAGLGTFVYQGDLSPRALGSYNTLRLNGTLGFARTVNKNLSVRFNYTGGLITGDDALYSAPEYRKQRALSFKTAVNELSLAAVWDILGHNMDRQPGTISPYAFAGIGFAFTTVTRDASRINPEYFLNEPAVLAGIATDLATPAPRGMAFAPVGIGVRYAITNRLSAFAEGTYRLSFNDYLDGFKQGANPKSTDHYYGYNTGLIFQLGSGGRNGVGCPVNW